MHSRGSKLDPYAHQALVTDTGSAVLDLITSADDVR